MSTESNKALLHAIFAELAVGNAKPLRDAMADDFIWTVAGVAQWARVFRGKQAVLEHLFRPLFSRFATPYLNRAERFIAEGEYVVVQGRGEVTTTSGEPYNNAYCFIFRVVDGRLREVTEYMDTELATRALGNPDTFAVS